MSGSAAVAAPAWEDLDWQADAACRDVDPDLFFPDCDIRPSLARVKQAKLICRGCPVSADCLEWAMVAGEPGGIWGGLTVPERHRLARRRGLLRPTAANF